MAIQYNNASKVPWNKGKLVGQKKPLKLREIWEIRIRLKLKQCYRELAMFDLAIDSYFIFSRMFFEFFYLAGLLCNIPI